MDVDFELIKALLISVVLGFAIGLQRTMAQYHKQAENGALVGLQAGSRTFALIAFMGFISGWLAQYIPLIIELVGVALIALVTLSYYIKAALHKKMGMTTQIAMIVTYLLGIMVAFRLEQYAVFGGVLMIVILELKPKLQKIEEHILPSDLSASVLLLAMTFLILPILPDKAVDPYGLFNLYKMWLMAIIVAAISFVGYVAIKILGNRRGVLLTGLFGGLVSSTAVTVSLSRRSVADTAAIHSYAAGIAMASTLMYARVLLETYIINPEMAILLLPAYLAATLSGLAFVALLYRRSLALGIGIETASIQTNPLQLSEAVKFGLIFGIIYGAIGIVQNHLGEAGVYFVSIVSGVSDVDAVTLSLSQLVEDKRLAILVAAKGIVIASVTNSLVKLGIVFWMGGSALGWIMARFFIVTLGAMGLVFWLS